MPALRCIRVTALFLAAMFAVWSPGRAQDPSPWGRKASLLEPISEQIVLELDGKLYSIAGITPANETVATMQVYDVKTDKWSYGPPLPAAVNHHMGAVAGGRLYVFGGQSASPTPSPFVDTTFEFDPATQEWRARAAMPTARSAGAAAVLNNRIYVAGGRPPRGHDFAVYDPAAGRWTVLPELPTARNHLVVAALRGRIFVAGGRFDAGSASPTTDIVEVYDPGTRQWSTAAPMPGKRGGINGGVANGCLHVLGGEGNREAANGMFTWHEIYNPGSDSWSRLADMPIPMHGVTGLPFIDGLLFYAGGARGQGGNGRSDLLQTFQPAMNCR